MSSDSQAFEGSWRRQEFAGLDFKDTRLTERLIRIADALSAHPVSAIRAACQDWSAVKAAYRFFDNEKVSEAALLAPHFQQTTQRMRSQERVFAIQDTTYLDYTDHPSTQGLGPIRTRAQNRRGFVKHTTLAVRGSGVPLGCLTDNVWVRDASDTRDSKPKTFQERESYKWIQALSETQTRTPEGVEVITVCDREADIYEFFTQAKDTPFVIRAAENRKSQDAYGTLKTLMKHTPVAGGLTLEVPARQDHPARQADLHVRFAQTRLKPPQRSRTPQTENLPDVDTYIVEVREPNPPEGVPPLHWVLLTNVKVNTYAEALERIHWYTHRWHIEVYFKVLKSGTKVEQARLQTKDRLLRYIALVSVIAWRLYWLTLFNRHAPDTECTHILTENQWKALYATTHKTCTLPTQTPTVRQATVGIAKLGGFLGRKSDGMPGVTVLWRGWQRLTDISNTWSLFHQNSHKPTSETQH
ncbi:IS4 family transposase [Candidatus Poribacteria bacterium]|nr:IS4 family transposase [Candidatus Poribacteria bacterium]MYA57165.1 IS4 family transposase [Candidatus Poribacteria bacterium]